MSQNSQQSAWDREYQDPKILSLDDEPQQEVRRLVRWLRGEGIELQDRKVLDLGCGNGRNLVFLASDYGVRGIGYDFSPTAIVQASDLARAAGLETETSLSDNKETAHDNKKIQFKVHDIAEPYADIADASIDIVLDITASNSLYEGERTMYLREVARVLKQDGIFCVRTLCLDGDRNAHNLIKESPGPEKDTYILPQLTIMERTFTEKDFRALYGEHFEILFLKKQTGYQRWGSQSYKRRYMVVYMKKL